MSHFATEALVRRFGLAHVLWLAAALFILYGATIPFHWVLDRASIAENFARASGRPFPSLADRQTWHVSDVVQNILLFLPFGVLGAAALRHRPAVPRIAAVTVAGVGLSVGVEALQLCTVDRVSSLNDVAANALGTLIGVVAVPAVSSVFAGSLRRTSSRVRGDPSTFVPVLILGLVVCAAAWEPFDPTLDAGNVWAKLKAVHDDVWQHTGIDDQALQCLRFGMLTVALKEWGSRRLSTSAIVLRTSILGIALEISQLLVESRMPSGEDAVMAVLGSLVGAGVSLAAPEWRTASPRARTTWVSALIVLTWFAAATQMLAPFEVLPVHHSMAWVPFLSYYTYTTMQTVSHVLELVLIYLPVGFALSWLPPWTLRTVPFAASLAILMQSSIEYLQGWIVGRYPDVTDIGMAVIGCVVGAWLAGPRAEDVPHRLRQRPAVEP